MSEEFEISMGVLQGCVMSPRLFNISIGEALRDMIASTGVCSVMLNMEKQNGYCCS